MRRSRQHRRAKRTLLRNLESPPRAKKNGAALYIGLGVVGGLGILAYLAYRATLTTVAAVAAQPAATQGYGAFGGYRGGDGSLGRFDYDASRTIQFPKGTRHDVEWTDTREPHHLDPRGAAPNVLSHLENRGIFDEPYGWANPW